MPAAATASAAPLSATAPLSAATGLVPPLVLTMGDPAGIGLDITLSAWAARRASPLPDFVLLADPATVKDRAARLGIAVCLRVFDSVADAVHAAARDASIMAEAIAVARVPLAAPVVAGQADPRNAPAVIAAIERAVSATVAGEASAIVTNPIAKSVLAASGFPHPGHTEFLGVLGEQLQPGRGRPPVMMLACAALRVVPLTVHIPLRAVPDAITTAGLIATAETTAQALRRDFGLAAPRLAIAGLNPHAGEDGLLGREDIEIIAPAIAELRARGLSVTGPHPADTLFHAAARERYDAAIAMYHDQALIPIKTLAFDTGVNVTLGLPFVRTSPDHGTAFDIAGSGKASPASLVAALRLAADMAARRRAARAYGGAP